ncbi:hypothetical protein ST37_12300 [Vibrio sp. qd031]|uniref:tight adherence pilus pseudopilin TadF n=1 Tax=Vibrio sp. qd031 TaxID=1603038 RepID=UPI000A263699|nr:tight adherence pilus pseudopilin TadF [Vibrio sp. qd031]ORT49221.1 hypothetical protein ST37_12300 [Vibrio sp. qd031]
MKGINLYFKTKSTQRGAFLVEFAIMLPVLATLFLFTMDVMFKVSTKGKLDRLSYSAVSILKERTQFFQEREKFKWVDGNQVSDGYYDLKVMTDEDADLVYSISKDSMDRTMGDFDVANLGMILEAQNYTVNADGTTTIDNVTTFNRGQIECNLSQRLQELEPSLRIKTSWGRNANLYRVSVCYETENYVAGVLGNGFTHVTSSSVMVGR